MQRVVCSSSDEELQLQLAEVGERKGFSGVGVWQEVMNTFIRTYIRMIVCV